MNIIHKLTIRHMKANKRRTLVTVIGVIISVAMVTAVSTLGVSYLDLMKRQTIATIGEWHVQYQGVHPRQLKAIKQDKATKKIIIKKDLGYAKLKGSESNGKPYVNIVDFNKLGLKQFPIELVSGRLPKAGNEVVISEEIGANSKGRYKIGEPITLNIGERYSKGNNKLLDQTDPLQTDKNGHISEKLKVNTRKTFKIVGKIKPPAWETPWSLGYLVIGYLNQGQLHPSDTVDALVVANKINGSLLSHSKAFAKQHHIQNYLFNTELLRYYGVTDNNGLRRTLFSLATIIMAVIMIGSVALIYNAFDISVSERSRHLGMLSSVGATNKQKRNSVFFEGAVIGLISIPIGIGMGLAGIGITFLFINSFIQGALGVTKKLNVIVTPESILVACLVSIVTIFISTYVPARKASKISAIEAIRQTQDVKLTRKMVKTSKLIRKIFGIEAEIGLKNSKRNKRRYKATVFSLVISIVLFLSVSFFAVNLKKSLELSQDQINYDIQVETNTGKSAELEPLSHLENITKSTIIEQLDLMTKLDKSEVTKQLQINAGKGENGKYPVFVILHGLDPKSFKAYAKHVGINIGDTQNPTAIVIDKTAYKDPMKKKIIEAKTINTRPGKVIPLYSMDPNSGKEKFMNDVKISSVTDQVPMGIIPARIGGIDIIVSSHTLHQLTAKPLAKSIQTTLYLNSSDPIATEAAINKEKKSNIYVYNEYQDRQHNQQMIMLMSVFIYGFIALISLISIANIFNTISTSIALRKREFAMLKSVGMTPKGFIKMMNYESIFYGMKALLYGLPISVIVMLLIYRSLSNSFEYGFIFPWMSVIFVIAAIFVIVTSAMFYSIKKVTQENIIDALKQENI